MKHKIYFFSFALLLFLTSCKKNRTPPLEASLDFSKTFSISSSFDHGSTALIVDINLDDTVHAYAEGEQVGKPVKLELVSKNGWHALEKPQVPTGRKKSLGALGDSVVIEGPFRITQKLKAGQGPGEAVLHLQVCTNNACDRPRTHQLLINP